MNAKNTATVDAHALRDALTACVLVAGKNAAAQPVEVVAVNGGLTLTTTTGYSLIRATLPAVLESARLVMSGADAARIAAMLPKRPWPGGTATAVLELHGGSGMDVAAGGASVQVSDCGSPVPDAHAVTTNTDRAPAGVLGFSAAIMATLCKMPRSARGQVSVELNGPEGVMRSEWTHEGVSYLFLMMPVRL